jgi:hypothetical protein
MSMHRDISRIRIQIDEDQEISIPYACASGPLFRVYA